MKEKKKFKIHECYKISKCWKLSYAYALFKYAYVLHTNKMYLADPSLN